MGEGFRIAVAALSFRQRPNRGLESIGASYDTRYELGDERS
jgi:hypothetical protein